MKGSSRETTFIHAHLNRLLTILAKNVCTTNPPALGSQSHIPLTTIQVRVGRNGRTTEPLFSNANMTQGGQFSPVGAHIATAQLRHCIVIINSHTPQNGTTTTTTTMTDPTDNDTGVGDAAGQSHPSLDSSLGRQPFYAVPTHTSPTHEINRIALSLCARHHIATRFSDHRHVAPHRLQTTQIAASNVTPANVHTIASVYGLQAHRRMMAPRCVLEPTTGVHPIRRQPICDLVRLSTNSKHRILPS